MVANALPRNPLRNYNFRLAIISPPGSSPSGPGGGQPSTGLSYVAGVRTVSGLRAQIAAVETWEGGNNLHRYANPGKVTWEPITLEQGLVLDTTLEEWARAVLDYAATGKRSATGGAVKREVIIDVWDENAHPTGPPGLVPTTAATQSDAQRARYKRFHIHNAWISKYQALPKLDSMTSEVALLSVELMHEGWVEAKAT